MKNLQNLSQVELQSINGGGRFGRLPDSIIGVIDGIINNSWEDVIHSGFDTTEDIINIISGNKK